MALRNQPYIPLYVQDYLSDEKLSCCSLSSQGVYIRILCVLHKSDTYGGILFKQIPKQNFSSNQYFAFIISKQIGCTILEVAEALDELLFFEVLKIRKNESFENADFLYQKRMEKDFDISLKRSDNAKKGGGNPKLKENLFKQTPKQNTEYENVIEYVNENNLSNSKVDKIDFLIIKDLYNETCIHTTKINTISESRKKAINARIKEAKPVDIYQFFESVFQKVNDSHFLSGLSGGSWKANFDWILNKNNIIKIIEGNYENVNNDNNKNGNNSQWTTGSVNGVSGKTGKQSYYVTAADFANALQEREES